MRTRLMLFMLALGAGCHAVPVRKPMAAPRPTVPVNANSEADSKLADAHRFIGALMEENDVLREQVRTPAEPNLHVFAETIAPTPSVATASSVPAPTITEAPSAKVPEPELPLVAPNAEGLIDLASLAHPADVPVNPFTVRPGASDPKKELSLCVQGLCAGPNAAALINDHMYAVGDTVETLLLERIDPDTVTFRTDAHRFRITASEKPLRVRLP